MKKRILGIIAAIVVVAAIAGYNVYTSQHNAKLSDLALNNIEALADGSEGGVTIKCCGALWGTCKDNVKAPYVECTWN